ncbi:MAG: ferredoxin-type protein NapF [Thiovulaceae bacterium]|nr:ferredoxin-type protein NapF [Sulfurimonadaceae bacterium]
MERRELFGSLASKLRGETSAKKQESILRPPYNNEESLFHNECQNCDGKCATVCEEEIIKIGSDKSPYLNLLKRGCTYCDDCAAACEFGVLTLENRREINAKITINRSLCMSWSSVMCFSCKDPCLDDAIAFKSLFQPIIDAEKCTACGFCISRCPVEAIEVRVVG